MGLFVGVCRFSHRLETNLCTRNFLFVRNFKLESQGRRIEEVTSHIGRWNRFNRRVQVFQAQQVASLALSKLRTTWGKIIKGSEVSRRVIVKEEGELVSNFAAVQEDTQSAVFLNTLAEELRQFTFCAIWMRSIGMSSKPS